MPWTPAEQAARRRRLDNHMEYMQRQDSNFQDQLKYTFAALQDEKEESQSKLDELKRMLIMNYIEK
jgi:hypothetical protein